MEAQLRYHANIMNEPFKLEKPVLVVWPWKEDLFLYIEKVGSRVDYGTCEYDDGALAYGYWEPKGYAKSLAEARDKLQAFASKRESD
jgi:hypothetical protein